MNLPSILAGTSYILFGRVVELVLATALEGLLDVGVNPKVLNGNSNFVGHVLAFNLRRQAHDNNSIVAVGVVVERQLHLVHGLKNNAHTRNGRAI